MKTTAEFGTMVNKMVKPDGIPALVTFGRGGHTVYYRKVITESGSSSSREQGYDDTDSFFAPSKWWAHDYTTQRDYRSWEGVPFVDTRQAVETAEGISWVFNGPLVDTELKDGEIDELGKVSPLFASAVSGNSYGQLLAVHESTKAPGKAGSLDGVSVAEFCRGWKEHGATTGFIRRGEFVQS